MSAASPPRYQLQAPALDRVVAELGKFTREPLTRARKAD